MKQPKITVITAVYNLIQEGRENVFRECVDAIHNQTYKNIEHIIIYTPSADGTKGLIDEYAKKGWLTCYIQPTRGLWQALQKGIEVANGDFINFMNSDDKFSRNDAIELIVKEIIKKKADYAFSDAIGIREEGNEYYWKGELKNVPFGQCMCHQTLFVSMDVMREFGGFDFNYKISLDNHMMLKLQLKGKKPAYVTKPLVFFRHGGWSSQQSILDFKNDYKMNFYDTVGEKMGLTEEECGELWCFEAIEKKDETYCQNLANKIKNKDWRKTFLQKLNDKKRMYCSASYNILGFPIIRFFQNDSAVAIKFFNMSIFSATKNADYRTAKILGGLFKIIKTEKQMLWYMLKVKIFSKSII